MAQSVSATRRISRLRRHTRLRKKLSGTAERPRLVVHRSARHIPAFRSANPMLAATVMFGYSA